MNRRKNAPMKNPHNAERGGEVIGDAKNKPAAENVFALPGENDTLRKLQRKPIEGYSVPGKIIPGNNKGAIYGSSDYKNFSKNDKGKANYDRAYSVKKCALCDIPIDKCACDIK